MKTRNVLVVAAAAAAVVALVAVTAFAKTEKPAAMLVASGPGAAVVSLAPVKPVQSAPREEITGNLLPAKGLQLGFEVPGRLARILVKKGAPISEGQIIAALDPELLG